MAMEQGEAAGESFSFFPPPDHSFSDLDSSFTSSSTTSATTFSARSSLSLPSFSSSTPSSSLGASLRPLPHHRSDSHWSALRAAANLSPDGLLHLRHLRLLRPLGSGHLARVFHCRVAGFDDTDSDVNPDFAIKVIDLDVLARRSTDADQLNAEDSGCGGKMWHVRAEARALAALDHPFLPTLYARLDASHYACFLIDYCPGGDLHALLRRVRGHRLPLSTARFYAAEVLLALEYLHALGFVYRDLKPENVLLREDGHIMLSDFDLSFTSDVSPTVLRRRPYNGEGEDELEFVGEPHAAFSKACVGTHEYLAPEVANGAGHGSGVDWWAFGVFLFELIYGRTPFKGATKEATLRNILTRGVCFPDLDDGEGDAGKARDLIMRLLVRDPQQRMGATRGAAEIKRHPFFHGVQWPLLRSARAPTATVAAGRGGGGTQWRVATKEKRERRRWWSSWIASNISSSNGNIIGSTKKVNEKDQKKKKVIYPWSIMFGSLKTMKIWRSKDKEKKN